MNYPHWSSPDHDPEYQAWLLQFADATEEYFEAILKSMIESGQISEEQAAQFIYERPT